jgi:hypothetical protein
MRRERNDGRHRTGCPQEDILFRMAGAKKSADKPAPEETLLSSIE